MSFAAVEIVPPAVLQLKDYRLWDGRMAMSELQSMCAFLYLLLLELVGCPGNSFYIPSSWPVNGWNLCVYT
jgi:hypothetical protein